MSSTSQYHIITVTHKSISVNDIAKFYIEKHDEDISVSLSRITQRFGISECMYLETCNRAAYIMYASDKINYQDINDFLIRANPKFDTSLQNDLQHVVDIYHGIDAVKHLLRVVSSLDSLVLGERQILSQFRKAYDQCRSLGFIGDHLRLLQDVAVATAKNVYSKTRIGEKPLSVVSLAMNRLKALGVKESDKVALIGAGTTNALVGKFLKKQQFKNISIYNRSIDKGAELSKRLGASNHPLSQLAHINGKFDIIFICTSANQVLIDEAMYQTMLNGESSHKILIDLAVPRNIGPNIASHYNVNYIDIESLKAESKLNLAFRHQEIQAAEKIISSQINIFIKLFRDRQIELSMSHLTDELKSVKEHMMNTVFIQSLDKLTPVSRALAEDIMSYMEKKCIALPIKLAKSNL